MQSSVRPQKKVDLPRNSVSSNQNFLSLWTRGQCDSNFGITIDARSRSVLQAIAIEKKMVGGFV